MKRLAEILAALCLLLAAVAWIEHGQLAGYRLANVAAADSLVAARKQAADLDLSILAALSVDSARQIQDARDVAAENDTTDTVSRDVVALQDSVASLADSLTRVDSSALALGLRAAMFRLRDSTGKLLVAILDERAAAAKQHRDDSTAFAGVLTSALAPLEWQRDDALNRAQTAIAGELEAQHRWPVWRRVLTAGSCALAGAGAITKKLAVAGGAGAVCGVSLALP